VKERFHVRTAALAGVFLVACATAPVPPPPPETVPAAHGAPPQILLSRSPFKEPQGKLNAEVGQGSIGSTICIAGWTATVRPPTSYTNAVKQEMLQRAGLDWTSAGNYELDHFVPLALGGHPRSLDNLWLQPWEGAWNARLKDRLERTLQLHVCAGHMTLHAARAAIQDDWRAAYKRYVEDAPTPRGMDLDIDERVE
jgi:hypothetical protein